MTVAVKAELPVSRRQPAGRKWQQRVKEILQAGRDVFSEKGYERATTAEIAELAKYHQCGWRSSTRSSPSRRMKSVYGMGRA